MNEWWINYMCYLQNVGHIWMYIHVHAYTQINWNSDFSYQKAWFLHWGLLFLHYHCRNEEKLKPGTKIRATNILFFCKKGNSLLIVSDSQNNTKCQKKIKINHSWFGNSILLFLFFCLHKIFTANMLRLKLHGYLYKFYSKSLKIPFLVPTQSKFH